MVSDLVIHNDRVVCPRCDGNGFLYKVLLEPIHKSVIMCDECEAIWPSDIQSIDKVNFKDFTTYIQGFAYTYDEIKLVNIDYDWYSKCKSHGH